MKSSIRNTAQGFWSVSGQSGPFPRDLEAAVAWALPVAILRVPKLWIRDVETHLQQRRLPIPVRAENRPLHGCVCAYGGRGLIFLDGADGINEIRFTLAHEVAHFVLDYLNPRRRAVEKLGSEITAVLDGHRAAIASERVDALLARAHIGFYAHFMHRNSGEIATDEVAIAEIDADQLALELLAPEYEVRRLLPKGISKKSYSQRELSTRRLLVQRFGLPTPIARDHASRLCRLWFSGPSFREWLGIQ